MLSALGEAHAVGSDEVLDRYLYVRESAPAAMQEAPTKVEIEASLPRLKKHGIMYGLRLVTGGGRIAYSMLRFTGDNTIKTQVIARYLSAEIERGSGGGNLAISPVNYRFRYKGTADYAGRDAVVYRVAPKRKAVGLFKGELWLDSETAMPLREWGDLSKSPSIFVKRIRFVRDYVVAGDKTELRRLILTARALLVGEVDMTVWFGEDLPGERQSGEGQPSVGCCASLGALR